MKTYDLNEKILFKEDRPVKRHFLDTKSFNAALICLKEGQEIKPHPEDYSVLLTVLKGNGEFTHALGVITLGINSSIFIKKDEIRGIKALSDLVILGIQGVHKMKVI
jgi:quercetin dioxygenase-like cupin family protein